MQDVRAAIHVLPQEPLLIEGTLRENLDPHGVCTDEELESALDLCGLSEYFGISGGAEEAKGGLDSHITFGGDNLSAGQTQLICMARAIVHKPKILVMDEGEFVGYPLRLLLTLL